MIYFSPLNSQSVFTFFFFFLGDRATYSQSLYVLGLGKQTIMRICFEPSWQLRMGYKSAFTLSLCYLQAAAKDHQKQAIFLFQHISEGILNNIMS